MVIYHAHISTVSRTAGRSAVAAAAYCSGERLVNERDGTIHDYTHRQDVAYSEIILPPQAPRRWMDRSVLWNDAERIEKSSRAQVARQIEYALPKELDLTAHIKIAREVAKRFAQDGMVVDFSIHTKKGNPHVHMMLSMRACDQNGFCAKSVNEYLVRDDQGHERYASAKELKALGEAWAKVYRYKQGSGELTQAEAKELGLHPTKDRKSKAPVQRTRYLTDWNEKDKADLWRKRIADAINDALAASGETARVDHRSYAKQGIERVPTVHEGSYVRQLEERAYEKARREGKAYEPVTQRRKRNIEVRSTNAWLAQATAWIANAIKKTTELTEKLELKMELKTKAARNTYSEREAKKRRRNTQHTRKRTHSRSKRSQGFSK